MKLLCPVSGWLSNSHGLAEGKIHSVDHKLPVPVHPALQLHATATAHSTALAESHRPTHPLLHPGSVLRGAWSARTALRPPNGLRGVRSAHPSRQPHRQNPSNYSHVNEITLLIFFNIFYYSVFELQAEQRSNGWDITRRISRCWGDGTKRCLLSDCGSRVSNWFAWIDFWNTRRVVIWLGRGPKMECHHFKE